MNWTVALQTSSGIDISTKTVRQNLCSISFPSLAAPSTGGPVYLSIKCMCSSHSHVHNHLQKIPLWDRKKTLQVIIYQQSKIYRLSFFYTFLGLCVFATNCVHLYHFRASKGKYAIISIISRILKLLNSPNAIWPSYDSTAAAFPNCVTNRHSACVLTLSHSLVARETEESSGANGHDFRQASEGGRSRPRSWTLYRYTQTHTHTQSH